MYPTIISVETDKERAIDFGLLNPNFKDRRFAHHSITVFLARGYHTAVNEFGSSTVPGVGYDYSDRLEQRFGSDAHWAAWEVASSQGFAKYSAASFEAYLRELFEDPGLKLVHIMAGVSQSDGHAYQVFGYIRSN